MPIEYYQEPSETGSEIYVEPVEPISDEHIRRNDSLDAALQGSSVGQDPRAIYEDMQQDLSYDPYDRASMIAKNIRNTLSQEEDRIKSSIAQGVELNAEDEAARFDEIVKVSDDVMAEAKSYLMSIPSFSNLSEEVQEKTIFKQYLKGMATRVSSEMGIGQTALDFTSAAFIPQENLRVKEVAEIIGAEFTPEDLLDTTNFMSRLVREVSEMAPEKAVELTNTIVNAWPEIHGDNRMMLANFLNELSGDFSTDWKHVENWIERADQSLITLGLAKIVKGGLKAASFLKIAADTKNSEGMADAVDAAMKGELDTAGISIMDGAASVTPLESTNTLFKGADNSLTNEVLEIKGENDLFLNQIDKVNNFGLGLNEDEKKNAIERAIKKLSNEPAITDVRVKTSDDVSFTLSYKLDDDQKEIVRNFNRSAVGGFNSDGKTGYTNANFGITSPNFRFVDDKRNLVQLPEQIRMQGGQIRSLYDRAIKASLKGLNKKQMTNVDMALIKGDEWSNEVGELVGKEFSKTELVDIGVDGLKLSEKEYKAYKGIRKVVDHLYWANNKRLINDMKARNVKLTDWNGVTTPLRTYDSAGDAKNGYLQTDSRSTHAVIDREDGREIVEHVTDELIEKMYKEGFVLSKGDNKGIMAHGNSHYEWAFVRAEELREPSGMVLGRREGYMPKIRKNAHYFLKEEVNITIGNKLHPIEKTVRYFDNYEDAVKYKDSLPDNSSYRIAADREMSSSQLDQEYVNIGGGLFTGARKKEEIPFGLDSEKGTREDSLKALQRYINNVASNIPMSVYRVGLQERWMNHARDLKVLPGDFKGTFETAIHALSKNHASFKFLEDSHAQISFIANIPTEAEKLQQARMVAFTKNLEKFPVFGKPLSRRLLSTSVDDMAGMARGLTFHAMLGMYNPAQFAIQASGSLVALSINPVHGAKAIGQMSQAGLLDLALGSPKHLAKMKKNLASKGLLDEEAYDAWRRSGLLESVTHSNLDYHSLWSDVPYDANLFRKIIGNGDLFFKHGELVNSRISFFTAYNRWKELNKGEKVDDIAMKDILARTEQYRLNMSRANSAKFQKGLVSVPTQFQQVNTKFFEKLFGSDFTKREKERLLGTQAAIFGAAGVPIVSSVAPHVLEMAGVDVENTSSEVLNTIYNGVAGWMIQDYFDINSIITGRMTLGQDFIENAFAATMEPMVLKDVALGPFNEVYERSKTVFERMSTVFSTIAHGDDMEAEDFSAVGKILVKSLAGLPSSTANLVKAYDMTHSKFYKNKKGRAIFEWADNNTQTIAAQALGFAPQEVTDWYELNNRDGGNIPAAVKNTDVDRVAWLLGEMGNNTDASQARWLAAGVNALLSKYERPQDREEIRDKLIKALDEPEDAKYKQLINVLTNFRSEVQEGWAAIHANSKILSNPSLARELEKRGAK